ncbi:alpha/beta hydrolase [Usitatibacter palustris]|uniref:GPI inositol-deacylase PGAP1-like alpha/beta domain-containing protein n=1 Tax=Usitatibacter palustris TaxID=2732487 RepID=A0A6M4H4M6_9PROT|nr:alpha/beta hydrolase [Usitatibacter palustris]QJR14222.1 hypothetical protein DSM104440_01015 [Usitatibacter palustris]
MAKAIPRNKVSDVRGVGKLAVEAAVGLTGVVENLHHNITRRPAPLGAPVREPMTGISGFVYRSIRFAARTAGGGVDFLLGQVAPFLAHEPSSRKREAVLAALNGVLGDHLAQSANPLAIAMRLRRHGQDLELTAPALASAVPHPASRVFVLIHGLCLNDLQWLRRGHDHGAALERDAPAGRPLTALYLHYNSGRPIATNGRELAQLLESLCRNWPVPLEELVIVGHSMGGLVARSACEHAREDGHAWPARLRGMAFLGTPHSGAPMERGGNWIDVTLDASPYTAAFARLGRVRSAGITDLRHGSRVALPAGVECLAIAGSLARRPGTLGERLAGDGLVPLESALGHGAGPEGRDLFAAGDTWVANRVGHLALLDSGRVYRELRNRFC